MHPLKWLTSTSVSSDVSSQHLCFHLCFLLFLLASQGLFLLDNILVYYLSSLHWIFHFSLFTNSYSCILPPQSLIQFSSVAQLCPTLCDLMNRSTPGLPVHHQHPEFTQIHVHRVSNAIQSSHPLSSPSSPAPNPSQHQSLFQ